MRLSANSREKFVNILTGTAGVSMPLIKKDFDDILYAIGEKESIEYYDDFFNNYPEIKSNSLYNIRNYKLEKYIAIQLQIMNGTAKLYNFLSYYFKNVYRYSATPDEIVEYLNRSFDIDGYSIEKIEETKEYKIYSIDDCLVNYDCLFKESERGNYILINEHNEKCFNKIKSGDYTGAITNSRSLLEQILCEIKAERLRAQGRRVSGYNGDIGQLVDDTFPLINFQLGQIGGAKRAYENLENGFKDLINGLAILRIGMSDAHSITYIPTQKDAIIAVNTAKTLANFIVSHYFEHYVNAA